MFGVCVRLCFWVGRQLTENISYRLTKNIVIFMHTHSIYSTYHVYYILYTAHNIFYSNFCVNTSLCMSIIFYIVCDTQEENFGELVYDILFLLFTLCTLWALCLRKSSLYRCTSITYLYTLLILAQNTHHTIFKNDMGWFVRRNTQ